jgi:hypothetical protein
MSGIPKYSYLRVNAQKFIDSLTEEQRMFLSEMTCYAVQRDRLVLLKIGKYALDWENALPASDKEEIRAIMLARFYDEVTPEIAMDEGAIRVSVPYTLSHDHFEWIRWMRANPFTTQESHGTNKPCD